MNTSRKHPSVLTIALRRLHGLVAPLAIAVLVSMIVFTGGAAASPVVEQQAEDQAELARVGMAYHLVDSVLNRRDASAATELISEDAVIHTAEGDYTGPQGLLDYVNEIRSVYPDARFEVTNISISDRGLTLEWTMSATRYQVNPGEPPVGVNTEISTVATINIDNAQIADATFGNADVAVAAQAPVPVDANRGQPY